MNRKTWSVALSCMLALVGGCGGGGGGAPDTGTVTDGGGGGTDGGGDGGADTGPTGDGNDTFADADPVTVGGAAASGAIDPAGDEDYFSFSGAAGDWVRVITVANTSADPAGIDTVVTLFDPSMTQIAANDDAIPVVGTDSDLVTLLPTTGTYYVRVTDHDARGMASFDYQLFVQDVAGMPGAVVDAEGGDDAASAQAIVEDPASASSAGTALVVGELDHASDVDVYSLEIRADAATPASFGIYFTPFGTDGDGASAAPAHLRIVDAVSTSTLGQVSPGEVFELSPALEVGHTYQLFVERGSTTSDFYVLQLRRGVDFPAEAGETTNGLLATPEVLTFDEPVGTSRSAHVLAQVPAGDTDYYRVTRLTTEMHASIDCASQSTGSGVQGLEARLFSSDGVTQLAMATETTPGGLHVPSTMLGSGNDYLVKLSSSGIDPSVVGTWVRCTVTFAP